MTLGTSSAIMQFDTIRTKLTLIQKVKKKSLLK